MNKQQFTSKVDEMLPELTQAVRKEAIRLYESGGLNPPDYEDNYLLPKICIAAAVFNQVRQYRPLDGKHLRTYRNILHF